jgi:hypothetical protein
MFKQLMHGESMINQVGEKLLISGGPETKPKLNKIHLENEIRLERV